MTPQELLRIARNINPEKLESDPQSALEDAYIVAEAFRLEHLERLSSAPSVGELAKEFKQQARQAGRIPSLVDRLKAYIRDHPSESAHRIAKRIGVSGGVMDLWLKGKYSPSPKSLKKLEVFFE